VLLGVCGPYDSFVGAEVGWFQAGDPRVSSVPGVGAIVISGAFGIAFRKWLKPD